MMKLSLRLYTAVAYFQILLFVSIGNADRYDNRILLTSNDTQREKHGEEYCAMYDICGKRSDGKVLNCPFGSPSIKPDDLLSAKIQSLCPTISGNICCTEFQFDTLRSQVQQAIPFPKNIIACEGGERKERHEKLEKWVQRLDLGGFGCVPLSYYALLQAKRLVQGYSCDGCRIKEENGCVVMCWQDRPLFSVSAWKCRR